MKARLLLFILLVTSFSCKEDLVPTPYTYSIIFTGENSKTWKIKFLEETLDGEVIDTFTVGCSTDDKYTFYNNSDHTYEVVTGSSKCWSDPEEENKITDTWTFTNASATITMILPFFDPEFSYPFIVREVDKDNMEIEIFFGENRSSYRIHFDVIDED